MKLATVLSAVILASAAAADLPVRQVVLYKHGVGYFERAGELRPGEGARLDFKPSEMNDVLKSLIVQDPSGGKISGIRYDSSEPLAQKLAAFPFALGARRAPQFVPRHAERRPAGRQHRRPGPHRRHRQRTADARHGATAGAGVAHAAPRFGRSAHRGPRFRHQPATARRRPAGEAQGVPLPGQPVPLHARNAASTSTPPALGSARSLPVTSSRCRSGNPPTA